MRRCSTTARADGDAIDQQRAGVVEQALAFEDLQHAIGQLDLAQDRDRGGRIRRRDDGAERDRGGPRHVRQQPVRHKRDRSRGQADGDDDQGRDRHPVVAEIAQGGVEGGVEQHRRDEQRQRQIGSSVQDGLVGTNASSAPPMASKVG